MNTHTGKGSILFLTDYYSDYQKQLIEPLRVLIEDAGYGLVVVLGGVAPAVSDELDARAGNNAVINLLKTADIHGVIAVTPAASAGMTTDEIADFLAGFGDIPIVSIGTTVPGVSSFVLDNAKGMRECMQQLTSDPNNQVFMFVGGTKSNPDSIDREAIFRSCLAASGVPVDDSLVLYSDFVMTRNYRMVKDALQKRPDVDVIVCVNDDTAESIVFALKSMNLAVPQDIRVSGFDDSFAPIRSKPSISTVNQNYPEIAQKICQLIIGKTNQELSTAKTTVVIPTRFISRESTLQLNGKAPRFLFHASEDQDIAADLVEAIIERVSQPATQSSIANELLKAALKEAANGSASQFRQHLQVMLATRNLDRPSVHWWQSLAVAIEDRCQELPYSDYKLTLQSTLNRDLKTLFKAIEEWESVHQFQLGRSLEITTHLLARVGRDTDTQAICSSIRTWAQYLEIKNFFLVLYTDFTRHIPPQSKLMVSCVNGHIETNAETLEFDTKEMLPSTVQHLLYSEYFLLAPIHSAGIQFGYMLIDPRDADYFGSSLDSLGDHIGRSIRLLS